jgi:hypothetical protein
MNSKYIRWVASSTIAGSGSTVASVERGRLGMNKLLLAVTASVVMSALACSTVPPTEQVIWDWTAGGIPGSGTLTTETADCAGGCRVLSATGTIQLLPLGGPPVATITGLNTSYGPLAPPPNLLFYPAVSPHQVGPVNSGGLSFETTSGPINFACCGGSLGGTTYDYLSYSTTQRDTAYESFSAVPRPPTKKN